MRCSRPTVASRRSTSSSSRTTSFFPIYNPALNVRKDVIEEYPQIAELFAPISEKLTTQELQALNAKVDVDGQLEDQVAEEWLSENGFI